MGQAHSASSAARTAFSTGCAAKGEDSDKVVASWRCEFAPYMASSLPRYASIRSAACCRTSPFAGTASRKALASDRGCAVPASSSRRSAQA